MKVSLRCLYFHDIHDVKLQQKGNSWQQRNPAKYILSVPLYEMLRNKFLPFRKTSDCGLGAVDIGFVIVAVVVVVI